MHATNTSNAGHCNAHIHVSEDCGNGWNILDTVGETITNVNSQGVTCTSDNLAAQSINANIHISMDDRNVNNCETLSNLATR